MRQATVTLLTLVIECKPNATAFAACSDTSNLLTRFLPSCGDFNSQVPSQSALGLTRAIATTLSAAARNMQVTVLIRLSQSWSIALMSGAFKLKLDSCTSLNWDVMLHMSACVLIGCIVQMDVFEIMYRACRSTGNAACMPKDFPIQACCPDVCE